jgi:hypothetical protein
MNRGPVEVAFEGMRFDIGANSCKQILPDTSS